MMDDDTNKVMDEGKNCEGGKCEGKKEGDACEGKKEGGACEGEKKPE